MVCVPVKHLLCWTEGANILAGVGHKGSPKPPYLRLICLGKGDLYILEYRAGKMMAGIEDEDVESDINPFERRGSRMKSFNISNNRRRGSGSGHNNRYDLSLSSIRHNIVEFWNGLGWASAIKLVVLGIGLFAALILMSESIAGEASDVDMEIKEIRAVPVAVPVASPSAAVNHAPVGMSSVQPTPAPTISPTSAPESSSSGDTQNADSSGSTTDANADADADADADISDDDDDDDDDSAGEESKGDSGSTTTDGSAQQNEDTEKDEDEPADDDDDDESEEEDAVLDDNDEAQENEEPDTGGQGSNLPSLVSYLSNKVYVAVGDSLTRGKYKSKEGFKSHPYTKTLGKKFLKSNTSFVEIGLHGETSVGLLKRIDSVKDTSFQVKEDETTLGETGGVVGVFTGSKDLTKSDSSAASILRNIINVHKKVHEYSSESGSYVYTLAFELPQSKQLSSEREQERVLLNRGIAAFQSGCSERVGLVDLSYIYNFTVPANAQYWSDDFMYFTVQGYEGIGVKVYEAMNSFPTGSDPVGASCNYGATIPE
jgi:hypothetical protein